MRNFRYIKSAMMVLVCTIALTTSGICVDKVDAQTATLQTPVQASTAGYTTVAPLSVVESPKSYLGKTVVMTARFDKFSTLGLDYKSAFKSSDEYISFLVKRDDTQYDIPLSEMKLFLKRDEAEKFIDLKSEDKISIVGTVFSDALGDAWIDVKQLNIVEKSPEKDGVKK